MADAAPRLHALAEKVLNTPVPVRIRAWDRSEAGPPGAPTLVIRHRRALRRILWRPGELGLARAWVAGEIDIEGDLFEALDGISQLLWERDREADGAGAGAGGGEGGEKGSGPEPSRGLPALARDPAVRAAARELVRLAGPWPPPPPPPEEVRNRTGLRHTLHRDRRAISHHYDVGNEFYELVLGPSMVYSCGYWDEPGTRGAGGTLDEALDEAQHAKLDLICRKLALRPDQRLLDVGCGWGSMVLHAAREYGVQAVGVTLSQEQASYARKRIADAGLTDRIEVRVQDYREVADGPYDAISSIGMAEHVGSARYREYAEVLHGLLKPGGRLLNHQIARRPAQDEEAYEIDDFIDAYVFPDGELAPVGRTIGLLEEAGFEVRDLESLREHYAWTLRSWVARLETHWSEANRFTSPGRARVWRLYMAASALAFEHNRIGVNQVLAVRTPANGRSGLPLHTRDWQAA
ncbi:cyclopropane-fatty-acyl-phospholipid synthase family protein [Streptomyces sp. N2-109]|uniref:Cyclopropane-fatty-acyl-phospholipid synthase family protein n=1 Tax=Streptomyces gossypii TaxID=2883101 RepID=A0ABT2K1A8_9ACTN|nr:cyclopropane-fatty-acyl-phospholipid synthase family protein [Streptomyces gossypii]MCT2592955.1 cyclopropane-fatty-acyl-phospholipid synthase family protein [Streptomyces gossypii]MCT2593688.1 cyclopropane-fatty-acyl-phospholipid synthase family protein [Streptomyces gossypii]